MPASGAIIAVAGFICPRVIIVRPPELEALAPLPVAPVPLVPLTVVVELLVPMAVPLSPAAVPLTPAPLLAPAAVVLVLPLAEPLPELTQPPAAQKSPAPHA